jgi:CheY-like chemotaxis protein
MASDVQDGVSVADLRRALYHLYDPAVLRRNALVRLFGLEQSADPASVLRRLLTEAIEELKPAPSVPSHANAWRTYHLLSQRFTEQFTQREVATDLGLSIRQLRRQETIALRLLADHLAAGHGLMAPASSQQAAETVPNEDTPSREQELEWVRRSLPSEPVDLGAVCEAALKTIAPLTRALRVRAECEMPPDLPHLAGRPATLRQAMLNILTAAVRCVPDGQVCIEAEARGMRVLVRILPTASDAPAAPLPGDHLESLEMATELVGLSGGIAEVLPAQGPKQPFAVCLTLPSAEQRTALVIDDNADTLQLLDRYLVGSRYRFVGTSDPQQALTLAEQERPDIIVLDVMLPDIDGWELLGRLREHPSTRGVPIILCTILPQEHLAAALGAAALIRKPVSRAAFLSALDRQLGLSPRGCG